MKPACSFFRLGQAVRSKTSGGIWTQASWIVIENWVYGGSGRAESAAIAFSTEQAAAAMNALLTNTRILTRILFTLGILSIATIGIGLLGLNIVNISDRITDDM